MTVVGVDPSLTATGYDTGQTSGVVKTRLRGVGRMIEIRDTVLALCKPARLVVIEAPAFAAQGRSVKEVGGVWWVVRVALSEAGTTVLEVPPSCLKKYATGRGNAKKIEVVKAAWERLDYKGTDDDIADAMWLRQIGLHYLDAGAVAVPASHAAGLKKIDPVWKALCEEVG